MIKAFSAALLCGFASVAAHAVSYTSTAGAPDPGALATETRLIDFNSGLPAGVVIGGNSAIVTGTTGAYATPAGDATPYLVVPGSGTSGTATLDLTGFAHGISSLSFYWGSIDTYNTVEFLSGSDVLLSLTGGDFPPGNGDQFDAGTNRRAFFTFAPGENLTGIRFTSSNLAFEIDDIAIAAIPEPRTWATMVLGFGLLGVTMRRRARNTVTA